MRIVLLAALALLIATPAMAQTGPGTSHNRTAICPQAVPCPDSGASLPSSSLISIANSCVTTFLGYRAQGDIFQDMGLDGNECLTTNSDIKDLSGAREPYFPHCCVIKLPDNSCALNCELASAGQ